MTTAAGPPLKAGPPQKAETGATGSDANAALAAFAALRDGGKGAVAAALTRLERAETDLEAAALLDAALDAPRGATLGVTGPPGVGKSSLLSALTAIWRGRGLTVAVIAVDPSSRRSGGAILGDRVRMRLDPEDRGVFFRSMAARERLGGLSALTFPAMVLLRALYDRVIVETVGVGQSETDVVDLADLVMFCIQPASGDVLQFMKAGVMEIPDMVVVNKADMGAAARRAAADARGALALAAGRPGGRGPHAAEDILLVSASTGAGMPDLAERIQTRIDGVGGSAGVASRRRSQTDAWVEAALREDFGRLGAATARARLTALRAPAGGRAPGPFEALARLRRERLSDAFGA